MNMLRHFYNDFMALVPLQLPQLIDVTTMEKPQFYGDYVLLTFPLYHHIPMRVGEFGYSTCAYSNPAFGQMFKMNARTEEDGKVHVVVATVYDSLELRYGDLCLDLELHARSGTFKYKKIKEEVLMDFL